MKLFPMRVTRTGTVVRRSKFDLSNRTVFLAMACIRIEVNGQHESIETIGVERQDIEIERFFEGQR